MRPAGWWGVYKLFSIIFIVERKINMNTNKNTTFNTEKNTKIISNKIIKVLIDNQVSYNDAQEILRIVSKKIGKVEINPSSLKVL